MTVETCPPYVAGVRVIRADGQPSYGTGLLVGDRHIVTCLHVVHPAFTPSDPRFERSGIDTSLPSVFEASDGMADITVSVGVNGTQRRNWRPASVIAEERSVDLVILEVERPVRGIVAPVATRTAQRDEEPLTYRANGRDIAPTRLPPLTNTSQFFQKGSDTYSAIIQHDHAALEGNSGAPVILRRNTGDFLLGIVLLGGLGRPTGVMATAFAVEKFIATRNLKLPEPAQDDSAPEIPGVAPFLDLPRSGGSPLRFRPQRRDEDGEVFFRAVRPLDAASALTFLNGPTRTGHATIPAHVKSEQDVATILSTLQKRVATRLRLPLLDELQDLRRRHGQSGAPAPQGLPLALDRFDHPGGPAIFAEWVEDRAGARALAVFAGEKATPVSAEDVPNFSFADAPFLRFGLQPILVLE